MVQVKLAVNNTLLHNVHKETVAAEARASNFKHLLLCINPAAIRLTSIGNLFSRAIPNCPKLWHCVRPITIS